MSEQWRPVLDYDGVYEVSDRGRVRSFAQARYPNGRILKTAVCGNGYLKVVLSRNGVTRNCMVHRLVLEAFIGPRPRGMVACHGDGVNTNNQLTNLRWDTPSANEADKKVHGTTNSHWGARTHCTKGHEYTTENVIPKPDYYGGRTWRACRECARIRQRAYKRRKKDAIVDSRHVTVVRRSER